MKLIVYSAILLGAIGASVYALAPKSNTGESIPTAEVELEKMNTSPTRVPDRGIGSDYGDTLTKPHKQAQESSKPTRKQIKKMQKPTQDRPQY